MSLHLALNCVVLGDHSSRVFTIEIEGTKNVSALKELIKEKNKPAFDHVPAHAFEVYKVSLPVDDGLDTELSRFRPEDERDHLLSNAVKRLKGVFGDPIDEHLHVIVLPPPAVPPDLLSLPILELNCFVQGDDASQVFPVKIANNKLVSALKEAIKDKKKPALDHVDADSLKLWKVSIPVNDGFKENVSNIELRDKEALSPVQELSDIFSGVPTRKHVHIIVHAPLAIASHERRYYPSASEHIPDSITSVIKRTRDSSDNGPSQVRKRRRLDLFKGSNTIYRSEPDPDSPAEYPHLPTNSDFHHLLTTPNILAVDKTAYIKKLDKEPQYQYMFLRPRRWGKSTFLQMLANYYDKTKVVEFDDTFGQLYIGKNPTKDRSSLLILLFDFSSITTCETLHETRKELNALMLRVLREFLDTNKQFLGYPSPNSLLDDDGAEGLQNVLTLARKHNQKLFVGVDEYDAPASSCLFSTRSASNAHHQATFSDITQLFKSRFFAVIKESMGRVVQKYWLTGVLPAFRDGISPLTATEVISMWPEYSHACGLTGEEVRMITEAYLGSKLSSDELEQQLRIIKGWYNGYKFCPSEDSGSASRLYNPQLFFTHLRTVGQSRGHVNPFIEANATHNSSVLKAISTDGDMKADGLLPLLCGNLRATVMTEFGAPEVQQIGRNANITWTLLYYFGVITHGDGKELRIPNTTNHHLVTGRFRDLLQHTDTKFTTQMIASCDAFIEGKPKLLVDVLEHILKGHPVRVALESNEATFRTLIEICWFDKCIPEVCLVVNPGQLRGHGRFGFIDLFVVPSIRGTESCVAVIELKNVTLLGILRAAGNNEPTYGDKDSLRQKLSTETGSQLLEREFCYWDRKTQTYIKTSIKASREEAIGQVNRYLRIAREGMVKPDCAGILDARISCKKGKDRLEGHVVMCIGGTRVLTWRAGQQRSLYSFQRA